MAVRECPSPPLSVGWWVILKLPAGNQTNQSEDLLRHRLRSACEGTSLSWNIKSRLEQLNILNLRSVSGVLPFDPLWNDACNVALSYVKVNAMWSDFFTRVVQSCIVRVAILRFLNSFEKFDLLNSITLWPATIKPAEVTNTDQLITFALSYGKLRGLEPVQTLFQTKSAPSWQQDSPKGLTRPPNPPNPTSEAPSCNPQDREDLLWTPWN